MDSNQSNLGNAIFALHLHVYILFSYFTLPGLHCTLAGLLISCRFTVDFTGSSRHVVRFVFPLRFLSKTMQFSSPDILKVTRVLLLKKTETLLDSCNLDLREY